MLSPSKKRLTKERHPKTLLQQLQQRPSLLATLPQVSGPLGQNLLSLADFQQILTEFSIHTTELEILEFISKHGKNNHIAVSTLIGLLTPKYSKSKSLTLSPCKRPSSITIERSILDKSTDISLQHHSVPLNNFFQLLELKLQIDLIIDYFFLNRNEGLTFEDFYESCSRLFLIDFDFGLVFNELAERSLVVSKEKFASALESYSKADSLELLSKIRTKVKQKFKNWSQAFETLKKNRLVFTLDLLSSICVKNAPSGFPSEFSKYEFKKFWFGKENICKIDTCIEKNYEFGFCDIHFKGLILRGEETLRKISVSVKPEKCIEVVSELLISIKKGTPQVYPNIHKRDIQALQMYLRYKQEKPSLSLSNTPC